MWLAPIRVPAEVPAAAAAMKKWEIMVGGKIFKGIAVAKRRWWCWNWFCSLWGKGDENGIRGSTVKIMENGQPVQPVTMWIGC